MVKKLIKTKAYNIHLIKVKDFKTIDIRIVFSDKIVRQDISRRNFLFDMLINSCKIYSSKRLLNVRCQELYSLYLNSGTFRVGNYLISKIGISLLNPKYTEESMLQESVDLFKEVLFNPNIENGSFNQKSFDLIKKDLENELETIVEQPRLYANVRLLENMSDKDNYRYHGYCYKEDLDMITPSNLYEYYKKIISTSTIDIFVTGDFNITKMTKFIRDNFSFETINKPINDLFIYHDTYLTKPKEFSETSEYKQAKLSIGCKLKPLTEFEKQYVGNVYNMLLGGISDSILMRNVREKYSLAYYVSSVLNKGDNIILINSGIDSKNYNKAIREIKKSIDDLKKGNFTDEDILKCQKEYISAVDITSVNQNGLMDLMLSLYLFNADSLEVKRKRIMEVKKEDIVSFANKVTMDTVFLLKGE